MYGYSENNEIMRVLNQNRIWIQWRGVASLSQIRTCVLEKLVDFLL